MQELSFARHFEDNWQRRVGGYPTRKMVEQLINRSVRIQRCQKVIRHGEPYRILAIYWHPELDLIIKLDPIDNCAVTVLSRACWSWDGKDTRHVPGVAAADDMPPAGSVTEMLVQHQQGRAG